MKTLITLFFAVILHPAFFILNCQATSYIWNGSSSTAWGTSANWTPSGVPGSADNVTIVTATNQPAYDGVAGVTNLTMTSGTLNLGGYTLNVSGTLECNGGVINNGTLSATGSNSVFAGTEFGARVSVNSGTVYFNGSRFNAKVTATKTGTDNNYCSGGNVFNDTVIISFTAAAEFALASLDPDTFFAPAYFNTINGYLAPAAFSQGNYFAANVYFACTGTGGIIPNAGGTANYLGNIYVACSNGTINFGPLSGSATLASNKTIMEAAAGFTAGELKFQNFTKYGNTPVNLDFGNGATSLNFNGANTFNGNFTYSGGACFLNGTTFNHDASFTINYDYDNYHHGGNTFNGSATFVNNTNNDVVLASDEGDDFNANLTLIQNGTGRIYPGYNGTSTYAGNINLNMNTDYFLFGAGNAVSRNVIDGTGVQEINGTGAWFKKLFINKTSGYLQVNDGIDITDSLVFQKGIIIENNFVILYDNAKAVGASDSSYVDGLLAKFGNDAFTYPVGRNGHYRPIAMSAPGNVNDVFYAEYFNQNSDDYFSHSSKDGSIAELSRSEAWMLGRYAGTSNVNVTLSWDTLTTSCSFADKDDLLVAVWDGSEWKDKGNGGTTGDLEKGTVVSSGASDVYGYYTLGTGDGFECKCWDASYLGNADTCVISQAYLLSEYWYSFTPNGSFCKVLITEADNENFSGRVRIWAGDCAVQELMIDSTYSNVDSISIILPASSYENITFVISSFSDNAFSLCLQTAAFGVGFSSTVYSEINGFGNSVNCNNASLQPGPFSITYCAQQRICQGDTIAFQEYWNNYQLLEALALSPGISDAYIDWYIIPPGGSSYINLLQYFYPSTIDPNTFYYQQFNTHGEYVAQLWLKYYLESNPSEELFHTGAGIRHFVYGSEFDHQITTLSDNNCPGDTVFFETTLLQNNPELLEYVEIDFGDGTIIGVPITNGTGSINNFFVAPSHVYFSSGYYWVVLTAENRCHESIDSLLIYIGGNFSYEHTGNCITDTYIFNGLETCIGIAESWHWNFGDGNTATGQNTTHNYQNTGFYEVTLTVITVNNDTIEYSDFVVVSPTPAFEIEGDFYACSDTAVFSVQSVLGFVYEWEISDATPAVSFTGQGTPEITVTDWGGAFANGATITVSVTNLYGCIGTSSFYVQSCCSLIGGPEISMNLSDTNYCIGTTDSIYYTATGTGIDEWLWLFGDEDSAFVQNTAHIYDIPGYHHVVLYAKDTNGCYSVSDTLIYILPACCGETAVYDFADINLSGTEYWLSSNIHGLNNDTAKIGGTITVAAGDTLSIIGVVLQFGPLGKIIIEPGGLLTTAFSTFTNLDSCGIMWQGIEVWGNTNINQIGSNYYEHGRIEIAKNVTIENAHIGILSGRSFVCINPPGPEPGEPSPGPLCKRLPYDLNFSGGIIVASPSLTDQSVVFRNNGNDIRFVYYPFANKSLIKLFDFQGGNVLDPGYLNTNSDYTYPNIHNPYYAAANDQQRTTWGIYNWQVNLDNSIYMNTFDNMEEGIRSFDAKYNVDSCDFTNMDFGIRIFSTNSAINSPHFIARNRFNYIGAEQSGNNQFDQVMLQISGNRGDYIGPNNQFGFTDSISVTPQNANDIGILLNNASAYRIIDNTFNKLPLGTWAVNSNKWFNIIRNRADPLTGNVYTRNSIGLFTFMDNRRLQIKCDNFINNEPVDYAVNWNVFNRLANQAALDTSRNWRQAGNQFTPEPRKQIQNVYNSFLNPNPIYFTYNSHKTPNDRRPVNVGNISLTANLHFDENSCPYNPTLGPIDHFMDEIANKTDTLFDLQNEYDTVFVHLDSGRTTILLAAIADEYMNEDTLKLQLLDASPLSDAVIIEALERTPKFSDLFYLDVLLTNTPLTDEVWVYLDKKYSAIHDTIIDSLVVMQGYSRLRTLKGIRNDIERYTLEKQDILTGLTFRLVENDSLLTAMEKMLEADSAEAGTMQAYISMLLELDSLEEAENKLNDFTPGNSEDQDWKTFTTLLLQLKQTGLTVFEMNQTQESTIRTIAAVCPPHLAAVNAQAILRLVYNEETEFDMSCGTGKWDGLETSNNQQAQEETLKHTEKKEEQLFKLYPNPANQSVKVLYHLNKEQKGRIEIYNINGVLENKWNLSPESMQLTISTSEMSGGVYLCRFAGEGVKEQTQKFVIVHD